MEIHFVDLCASQDKKQIALAYLICISFTDSLAAWKNNGIYKNILAKLTVE